MAINKYFNYYKTNTNEQTLVEDFFAEAIQIYGQDVYYIVRNIENEDFLFTEDLLSSFDESYLIEMYLENFDAFEGNDIISKFGFQIQDQMMFSVSVPRFREETKMTMPNEGDLIYLPIANSLFEIKFVEDEQQFYPTGTLPAFKLQCELFRYDNQDFSTGIPEVDALDEERDLSEGGVDPYADNEDIETESETITEQDPSNPFGSY
jgi:hypothetical protein